MFISKKEKQTIKDALNEQSASINNLVTMIRVLNNCVESLSNQVNEGKQKGWTMDQRLAQGIRMRKMWEEKKAKKEKL